jgi:tetratricopeptide (TPR) repeat protein
MKKILLLVSLFTSVATFAQSDKYKAAMKKNLELLDSAKTVEDYEATAAAFERIGDAEKTEWMPYYYAAFSQVLKAFKMPKPVDNDGIIDKAETFLLKAEAISPNNVELLCLRSMGTSARMMVDQQARAQQYAPRAAGYLQQAIQLDPRNPRAMYLLGQSTLYTPEFFGGGKAKAKPLLEKAVENFKTFTPASEFSPKWGKSMAEKLLAQASS